MAMITTTRTVDLVSPRRWLRRRSTLVGRSTRLTAVGAVLLLAMVLGAEAQQTEKTARIGDLTNVVGRNLVEEAFERALQELGWSRERNRTIESRYSGGRQDTVAALAAELVGLGVEVIVAWGPESGLAAKRATSQIPVVFCSMFADPVDFGIVSNLARPVAMSPESRCTAMRWTPSTYSFSMRLFRPFAVSPCWSLQKSFCFLPANEDGS
jgi:ABC transporter substrate binding protein